VDRPGDGRGHPPLRKADDLIGSLTLTAADAFRDHAQARRDELVGNARLHVASAAEELSSVMDRTLEETLARTSLPAQARPYVAVMLELLLIAALESALARASRRTGLHENLLDCELDAPGSRGGILDAD
jgi:hypothetical protein